MNLNRTALENRAQWAAAGIALPQFDPALLAAETAKAPAWLHFGAGNIFRAFPAAVQQKLLNDGAASTGIIVAEGYDYEIIDALFDPHDNLSLLVTLKADGSIEKTVVGSVTEALKADSGNVRDFARLKALFRAPSLQLVSFTITEKGYSLVRGDGSLLREVAADFRAGPAAPASYIGKLAALCCERYLAGALPLALVSMDNCSHNGDKLRSAVTAFAREWTQNGLVEPGFAAYMDDPAKVSFPWSMIDKITPRPDEAVKRMLADCGFEDTEGTVTAKHTFIAPFVNAEETQWLVIEDHFPNGRPPLEQGGVIFADRETVDKVEKMKVCTCLNPLHTALAIFGCLLGYTKISDEMRDADLVRLIETVGYAEGLPVVVNPGILDPKAFIDNVVKVRLPNPFMPDTPQRIACDTSQKLPIRFGETIKAYLRAPERDVLKLRAIPLVLAGWLRYLQGVDDAGQPFDCSPDPLLDSARAGLSELPGLLSDASIFGVDLYEAGLARRVTELLARLSQGPGSVRKALQEL
ncbi:MAG: mannitol dehydrogenase family protein [Oscillospiraceae bacterium]|jgi:fructuronate reductase|nr:mannitol dehydrogenase family protein [Oscillospiraceae bacterium]